MVEGDTREQENSGSDSNPENAVTFTDEEEALYNT